MMGPSLLVLALMGCGSTEEDPDLPAGVSELADVIPEEDQWIWELATRAQGTIEMLAYVARGLAWADLDEDSALEELEEVGDFFADLLSDGDDVRRTRAAEIGCLSVEADQGQQTYIIITFLGDGCGIPYTDIKLRGAIGIAGEADPTRGFVATVGFEQFSTLGLAIDGTTQFAGSYNYFEVLVDDLTVEALGTEAYLEMEGRFDLEDSIFHPTQMTFNGQGEAALNDNGITFRATDFIKSMNECYPTSGLIEVWAGIGEDRSDEPVEVLFLDGTEEDGIVQVTYRGAGAKVVLPDWFCKVL